jgi:hypothetical protein
MIYDDRILIYRVLRCRVREASGYGVSPSADIAILCIFYSSISVKSHVACLFRPKDKPFYDNRQDFADNFSKFNTIRLKKDKIISKNDEMRTR